VSDRCRCGDHAMHPDLETRVVGRWFHQRDVCRYVRDGEDVPGQLIGGFRDCELHVRGWGPLMELEIETTWAKVRMELNTDMATELRDWLSTWIEAES
jgi:hypothetical protein